MCISEFWQKDETCPVFPFFGDGYSLQKNEFVRNLEHDSRSVTCLVVSAFSPSVLHVFQHFQGGVHQFVGFVSVDVHEHAHSACVMFVACIIQTVSKRGVHGHISQVLFPRVSRRNLMVSNGDGTLIQYKFRQTDLNRYTRTGKTGNKK